MSFFKSLTLLLVAAIANPMCCCLSFAVTDFDEAPPVAADPHACCKLAEGSSTQEGPKAPKGDHDCPHEEIKVSQINDAPSEVVSISKGSVAQPVALVDASCIYASPTALAQWDSHSRRISSEQAHSGKSYSQAYCVFIL